MREFLQHLAASAACREQKVHPFVGGMFESAPWQQAVEAASPHERMGVVESAEHDATASIAIAEPVAAKRGPDVASEKPRAAESAVVEPKRVELLIPRNGTEVEGPGMRTMESKEFWHQDARGLQVLPTANARREEPKRDAASTPILPNREPLVLQPLLVGETHKRAGIVEHVGVSQPCPHEKQNLIPTHATRHRSVEHRTSPRAEERASEDIQIHIGRIEVIAAPPTPVASAAPPRKAIGLDEYLKKRSGRAQ